MLNGRFLKNALTGLFILLLALSTTSATTFALQDDKKQVITTDQNIVLEETPEIPQTLQDNIKNAIIKIYGEDNADQIYNRVIEIIDNAKDRRPVKLVQDDMNRKSDWYKDEITYMFYTEHFGRDASGTPSTFNDLIGMLDYLEDLGVTTIYMLPFMDSPMGDAGFDVRDPKDVRAELGGMEEFRNFVYEARKRGFKIKSDLILNHFSDQHKWFQEALAGDLNKLNYFVYEEELPKYKRYRDTQKGIIVDYYEEDGAVSSRRLIFPDIVETHYRKVMIGDEDYYIYHTFYPFQPDINWENPEVLYEVLEILAYWNNLGIDIFRVDAIPYFIKEKGTPAENLPRTHEIVTLLSSTMQATGPRSIMLAEACQWPKDILPYFGEEHSLPPSNLTITYDDEAIKVQPDRNLVRTDEVQMGYHFPYMPAIWASLITNNNGHFWKAVDITPEIPDSATWAMFLRVHDELTLEMVDLETRKLIYDTLIEKGKQFREGLGVSGRMANFLDKDPRRIALAYSILFSLPGVPIIYYGDEIGATNNLAYAEAAAAERERVQRAKDKDIDVISFYDSRDINRGPIPKAAFYEAIEEEGTYKSEIYNTVKNMIHKRKESIALRRGEFIKVNSNNEAVLSYLRAHPDQNILVLNNLAGEESNVTITFTEPQTSIIGLSSVTDILSGEKINITSTQDSVSITLKPYERLWLEL